MCHTNKIYLADSFLSQNENNLGAISDLILEEYGHLVDAEVNPVETVGDEGRIFARLVQGENLTPEELHILQSEDDTATIILDGQSINIEQAFVSWIGGDGDWYDPSNWSTGSVPTLDDDITISADGDNITITFSQGNPHFNLLALFAGNGATLDLSGLTSYVGETSLTRSWRALGEGSKIDLSGLTNLTGPNLGIGARAGGEIDLSNLTTINGEQTRFSARNNGEINLSALKTFTDDTYTPTLNPNININNISKLQVQNQGVIKTGRLEDLTNVGVFILSLPTTPVMLRQFLINLMQLLLLRLKRQLPLILTVMDNI